MSLLVAERPSLTGSPLVFSPDWSGPGTPLRKTWSGVGNIDQFRWLSRADVLAQLAMARDELGLRHVRACAMYGPEMRLRAPALEDWQRPAGERPLRTNWQLVDLALEGLLDLGLKPVYTTCFTPAGMTDDPASCWPDGNLITPPQDLVAWEHFVADGIRHHLRRFGRSEVRSWLFECWNEPNLAGFFHGTQEEFFHLWDATWRGVKSVDPDLRLGGPSTARGEWIPEFLAWTKARGTPPDYLITHVYNNDSEAEPLSPFDGPASHRVKDSPHFAAGVIRGTRRLLADAGWTGEVHWNEWGRSWFPHDRLKETALEAAFVVKTMTEVSQEADAFAFWCLSDLYDQCGFSGSEFDGNYGMLSLHGLKKPAWHAHSLLQRLPSERVTVSSPDPLTSVLAARDTRRGAALVAAYPEEVTRTGETAEIQLALPAGAGDVVLLRLGAEENNILAAWRELGAPAYPTRAELAGLRAGNTLRPTGDFRHAGNALSFAMERPGVALVEFSLP